jgi:protein involved in polysaccharide export with SLBB domain
VPTASPAAPVAPKEPPAAPAASKEPPAKTVADATREARDILEKMAEGETPPVKKIEAAEAAAEKTAKPAPAAEKKPAAEKSSPAASVTVAVPVTGKPAATPVAEKKVAGQKGAEQPLVLASAEKTPAAKADPPAEAPPAAGTTTAPSKDEKELGRWIWSDGKWIEVKEPAPPAKTAPAEAKPPETAKPTEVVAKPAETAKPAEVAAKPGETAKPAEGALAAAPTDETRLQLEKKLRRLGVVQGAGQLRRIIRFDVRALQAGDPTQNVVLRDSDVVSIPSPEVGDFYLAGEVARPGVYSLTGRKITLLQAIAAAGGLSAVAVPWRTEVVRRISEGEEEIIYADISKIARGEIPDFYMQAEDIVRVGTDQGAIFNAVFRNAFRATYGLGSVYDMNFADFYPWAKTIRPILP